MGRCPPSTARGSHTASWPAYMSFICTRSPAADSLLKFCLLLQLLPIPPRVEGRKRYSKSASAREEGWRHGGVKPGSFCSHSAQRVQSVLGCRPAGLKRLGRKDVEGKRTQQAGTQDTASRNPAQHEKEIYVLSPFLLLRESERSRCLAAPGTRDHGLLF